MLKKFGLVETNAKSVSVGDVYGRLTVIAVGVVPGTYRYKAVCRCECGTMKAIRFDALSKGVTVSCGCFHLEKLTTHGLHKSPHYGRWHLMMDRCYNPRSQSFPNYGGRGIKVCEAWHDITTFINQLPKGFREGDEIDRIDNDGDYEPNNVKWASKSENCNNRRSCRIIEYQGRSQTMTEWAREYKISPALLWDRLVTWGWSIEQALTTPPVDAAERMRRARETRWAGHTKKEKPAPKERKKVLYNGEYLATNQLSEMTGVSVKLLGKRIFERGWPVEKAVRPVQEKETV